MKFAVTPPTPNQITLADLTPGDVFRFMNDSGHTFLFIDGRYLVVDSGLVHYVRIDGPHFKLCRCVASESVELIGRLEKV